MNATVERLKATLAELPDSERAELALYLQRSLAPGPVPRQYSLVQFRYDQIPVRYHDKYPFTVEGVYLYFGEIPNMPGHCVVADHRTGWVYSGYHTENFAEIPVDKV